MGPQGGKDKTMNTIQALEFVAQRLRDQYEADLTGHTAHLDYQTLAYMLDSVVDELKEGD